MSLIKDGLGVRIAASIEDGWFCNGGEEHACENPLSSSMEVGIGGTGLSNLMSRRGHKMKLLIACPSFSIPSVVGMSSKSSSCPSTTVNTSTLA